MVLRYNLSKLANKPKKAQPVPLPEIHGSLGQERAYLGILRAMLKQLASQVRQDVVPAVTAEMQATRQALRFQTDIDKDVFTRLATFAQMLAATADRMVNRILGLEAQRHTKDFAAKAKRALGVDLSAVVREEDLSSLLETAAVRNASLIKGLADDTVKRVANSVTTALMNGTPAKELQKTLAADFGFSDRRAKVIARDQIAKLNSDMNRFRAQQAGIEKYRWRTSHDERVRPLHRSLDGKIYAYGEPTGAEQGLPPGQPVLCRCIAQAVVEFGEAAVSEKPQQPKPAPVVEPAVKATAPLPRLNQVDFAAKIEALSKRAEAPLTFSGDMATFHKAIGGIDPERFLAEMGITGGSDMSNKLSIRSWPHRNEIVIFGAVDSGNGAIGQLTRTLLLKDDGSLKAVDHTLFKLPATVGGGGLGKQILAKQVSLYRQLGVDTVKVHANIDVGGYAWAKYGYLPSKVGWAGIKKRTSAILTHRKKQQPNLDWSKIEDSVNKVLESDDPRMIWALADLPDGAGKLAMLGSDWQGTLNLKDKASMARFNAYVGQ